MSTKIYTVVLGVTPHRPARSPNKGTIIIMCDLYSTSFNKCCCEVHDIETWVHRSKMNYINFRVLEN